MLAVAQKIWPLMLGILCLAAEHATNQQLNQQLNGPRARLACAKGKTTCWPQVPTQRRALALGHPAPKTSV
jgi:hypothetical protein